MHFVTLTLLADEPDPARLVEGLEHILKGVANSPVDTDGAWLLDWRIDRPQPAHPVLSDFVCNETYGRGDAFTPWVIYSPSEAQHGAGYWSTHLGWSTRSEASTFDPLLCLSMPPSLENDAVLVRSAGGY